MGPKSLFDTPEARERSDEQLLSLFLGATADVDQYVLKTGAPANRTGISMFDQVLRQLDQIDEEPPKRPDDKIPLSPG